MPDNQYAKKRVLLITSYREKYTNKALKRIKKIILEEGPDLIVISKIIEDEPTPHVVEAKVGIEERQDFLETVREEKKEQANSYAENLIKLTESLDIPTEVRFRKGEEISEEIIADFNKMKVDTVIMHGKKKGKFRTVIEGSTAKKVEKELPKDSVKQVD